MADVESIFPGVDGATARLILEMQAADLEDLAQTRDRKGKQRQDVVDDFSLALQLYQLELESTSTSVSDHLMAASFAAATHHDGALIAQLAAQEAQAIQDRAMALAMNDGSLAADHEQPAAEEAEDGIDDDLLQTLAAINAFQDEDEDGQPQAESSAWAAGRRQPSSNGRQRQCVACMELRLVTIQAPCGDPYCRPCLEELVTLSLTDESLFPPRCHGQPIPAEAHRAFLGFPLVGRFMAKKLEFETPNRTYCYRPQCAAFIPPQFVRADIGHCVRCRQQTCAICKKRGHAGDCPEDPTTQDLLRLAQQSGWQQCYLCHRLVELRTGCNHISKRLYYCLYYESCIFVCIDLRFSMPLQCRVLLCLCCPVEDVRMRSVARGATARTGQCTGRQRERYRETRTGAACTRTARAYTA